MKRSSHKKLSRLLALAAIMVLLAMSLAGCFGKDTEPSEPSDGSEPTSTEGTESVDPTEAPTDPEPTETEPQTLMGTVNTDKLNVRTNADASSPSVQKLAVGTRVEILEQQVVEDVTWGRIADGWVKMKYVTLDGDTTAPTVDSTEPAETEPTTTKDSEDEDSEGTTGTITASELNVRSGPGTKYKKTGTVKKGDKVTIYEKSGNWGRTKDGWISLKYVKLDGSSDSETPKDTTTSSDKKYSTLVTDGNTSALGTVKVGDSNLNVRYGPSTDYNKLGGVKSGETLTYYQKSGNWIRIKDGWISYKYVTEVTKSSDSSSGSYSTGTGTVTASSLHIRKGAGTNYESVGKLEKGETVEILEVSGNWGKIDKGWICLDYVKMK